MDDSTLADVFNYVAFPQMSKHFGTEDHNSWSTEKCPVRIDLVRPKTGYRYYSFLDRDAIEALKDWLNVRLNLAGRQLHSEATKKPNELPRSDPLFIVKNGQAVRPYLVSKIFRDVALEADIIVRPNAKVERYKGASRRYAFHSHEVRDLLKSLARACGIDGPVADFFLGHNIDKFGYDKSPWNFPEHFREHYRKMSPFVNVLTGSTFGERGSTDGETTERLNELEADKRGLEDRLKKMERETKELKDLVRQLATKLQK